MRTSIFTGPCKAGYWLRNRSFALATWKTGRLNWKIHCRWSFRRGQEPVPIIHFPRQTWLLLCSGLLLTIGLALHMFPLSRPILWVIMVSLGLGLIAAGFLWPAWVPALLFGIQPGALVLGLILGIHWVLTERYRRQVIFMPGFTRLKPGSSLLQNPPPPRPREASTVDAPAPPGVVGRGSGVVDNPPN